MVRKVTKLKQKQSQKVNQEVNVKVHIGNNTKYKGKNKKKYSKKSESSNNIPNYTQPYTPVYIQSGEAPHSLELNPLLQSIHNYITNSKRDHKETLENPLYKTANYNHKHYPSTPEPKLPEQFTPISPITYTDNPLLKSVDNSPQHNSFSNLDERSIGELSTVHMNTPKHYSNYYDDEYIPKKPRKEKRVVSAEERSKMDRKNAIARAKRRLKKIEERKNRLDEEDL